MRKISGNLSDRSRACAHAIRLCAVIAAALWTASGLGACTAPVHRPAEPAFFHAGRAVDPRPDATFFAHDPRVLAVEDRDIATRAQDRLAYRHEPTLFDFDAWPPAPRTSLSDRRYLHISDRPTSYLYFQQPSRSSTPRGHIQFQPAPVFPAQPFDPRR